MAVGFVGCQSLESIKNSCRQLMNKMRRSCRPYIYWIVVACMTVVCVNLRWKRLQRLSAMIGPVMEVAVDVPINAKIQLTEEFQYTFMERVDSLAKRNASAGDPDLIQLVRELMVPPFQKSNINSTNRITPLVTEVKELLRDKTNGFYMECGALDGEKASNTIFFEHNRDWNGLLIEMDPEYFQELLTKRRHAWSINACVSPYNHIMKLPFKGKGPETPQLLMDQASMKSNASRFVTCFPLVTFLLALDVHKVDFFCFDIEGLEMQILKSFPFHRIDMTVLSVECLKNICNEEKSKDFMNSKGYETHKLIDIQGHNVFMRDFIFYKRPRQ